MVTLAEADLEITERLIASRSLADYTKYTKPDYEMTATQGGRPIHKQIIEKLEAVERGEIKRLMIFCRPRMGKSELASIRFPTWYLGRNPSKKIILASYGADLANDFGRKSKQVVESQRFQNIFPKFALSKDKKEGGNWETREGGGMYTVGAGGATTGKGGDILIIDDIVKDRLEAESPTTQQRTIDWYTSTLYTRRQGQDSAIILMLTRWNQNDLAGYLLKEAQNGGEKWEVLSIPAIDNEGNEIVWEGKWDKGYIQKERDNISKKDWAALYQQDPIASSSNIFSVGDIRYFLMSDFEQDGAILKKEDLKVIISVDPAFSSSADSDDAVVVAVGKHKISGNYYLLDGYAETSAPSHTFMAILSMYDKIIMEGFKVDHIVIESVSLSRNQQKFFTDFKNFLKEKDRYIVVNPFVPKDLGKKEDRIKFILEPKMSLNAINMRKDMPEKSFIRKLEDQISEFPHGRHDDVLDCLSQAVHVLDRKMTTQSPIQKATFWNPLTGRMETGMLQNKGQMFGL